MIDYLEDNQELINGFDSAKSNNNKECKVYDYWFFNHGFKYQDYLCNGSSNLLMLYVNISNITIIAVKGDDYYCIIYDNNKPDTINLLENFVLNDCSCI